MITIETVSFVLCLSIVYVDRIISYNCFDINTQLLKTVYYRLIVNNRSPITYLAKFLTIVSNYAILIILVIVNILIYIELRKIMAKKKSLKGEVVIPMAKLSHPSTQAPRSSSEQPTVAVVNHYPTKTICRRSNRNESFKSQRKTLIMVLWVSFAFGFSRLSLAIGAIVAFYSFGSVYNYYVGTFNFLIISIVYISQSFIYFRTNKIFKKMFYEILGRVKERMCKFVCWPLFKKCDLNNINVSIQ